MNDSIDIHIRWPNDQELLFSISYNKDTIQSIKQKIRYYAPEQTTKKTMRLIHRGQLLVHDQYTLSDYGIRHQPQLFIHCALSDPLIPTSTLHQTKETKSRLAGFDKLRESGYNDEEIRSIRLQFHQSHPDYIDGEPVSQELLALEETWIEHTGRLLPPEGSVQGSFKEMLCGLVLGCFLGVLCLFWFKESVFTRRHQMGIVAGMLINVSCGVMHVYS